MRSLRTNFPICALTLAASLIGFVGAGDGALGASDQAIGTSRPDASGDRCNRTSPPQAPARVTPEIARSGLPCSVEFGPNSTPSLSDLQQAFDFNSWVSFVALNGSNDPSARGDGRAVWQGWQDLSSLMLENGTKPPAFGTSIPTPPACTGAAAGTPVLGMISKTPTTPVLNVSGQPLNTGPLIDQNGNYVRYQILVNEPMYRYIVDNGLYSRGGQKRFVGPVAFPQGDDSAETVGAIMVKAAWKVLGPGDDPARFHVVEAYAYDAGKDGAPASCKIETLGLVGLHLVHKTKTEPQWDWATFEHVDNVPTEAVMAGHFNFYDPLCDASKCPANLQPPQPWDARVQPFPHGFHSQIVRATRYPDEAVQSADLWNPQFQAALTGSVLANYRLVTTQWPTEAGSKTDPNGRPFPRFAANSTMETYVQGNIPQGSSTCMACHGNATATSGIPSDFTFILEKAQ